MSSRIRILHKQCVGLIHHHQFHTGEEIVVALVCWTHHLLIVIRNPSGEARIISEL